MTAPRGGGIMSIGDLVDETAFAPETGSHLGFHAGRGHVLSDLNRGRFIIKNGVRINSTDGNGKITSGPYFSRLYDNRPADMPPYYPTTGNAYDIISRQRVGQALE